MDDRRRVLIHGMNHTRLKFFLSLQGVSFFFTKTKEMPFKKYKFRKKIIIQHDLKICHKKISAEFQTPPNKFILLNFKPV